VVTEATSNWCLLILVITIFRNPKRIFTTNENQILAPVDGKVVVIEEVYEEYYKDKRLQIYIHVNNVHVTRYAISGIEIQQIPSWEIFWSHGIRKLVKKTNELPSSLKTIRLGLSYTVAGALARRIVNYAEEGMQVVQGTDAGFIKFGSRVDLFYLSELNQRCA
jgi:phosphatidylserine decarboxylase